jgi:hypothetical protein
MAAPAINYSDKLFLTALCYTARMQPANDPLLKRFRTDSDYDVAVFLRDMPDRIAELYRLADLSGTILDGTGDSGDANMLNFDASGGV